MIAAAGDVALSHEQKSTWRRRLDALRRGAGFWAMADQGLVSLGNFLTVILLARRMSLIEFGAFAVLFEVILFLNSIGASLIIYPLCVKGAVGDRDELRRLTGASLIMTLLLCVPLGLGAVIGAWAVGRISLAAWVIAAMLVWQLQETLRRALTSHMRFLAALPGDVISYLGQVVYLAWFAWHGHITLEIAFASIAISSLIGAALQWMQVKPLAPSLKQLIERSREFWRTGYWATLSNLTTFLTVPSFAWVLGIFQGLAAVAIFQSFANLLKVANPIMNTVANLMIPAGSKANRDGGVALAWRKSSVYALQGAALLLPYFLVLFLAPHLVIRLAYGPQSPCLEYANMMRIYVLGYGVIYLSQITNAFLLSLHASRSAFMAQLSNVGACVVLGLPLAAVAGICGAVWGNLAATAARVIVGVILIAQLARREAPLFNDTKLDGMVPS